MHIEQIQEILEAGTAECYVCENKIDTSGIDQGVFYLLGFCRTGEIAFICNSCCKDSATEYLLRSGFSQNI